MALMFSMTEVTSPVIVMSSGMSMENEAGAC
jgi:hypothetical protein